MAKAGGTVRGRGSRLRLLGIYLNDHLGGATGGVELSRRMARVHRGTPMGVKLEQLAVQIYEDRLALLDIMNELGVRVQRHKVYGGWVVEKASRLKLNARILRRSPLSDLIELETMRLGVEGKELGWRTLRLWVDQGLPVDADLLDELLERAQRQAETLEELRLQVAGRLLG